MKSKIKIMYLIECKYVFNINEKNTCVNESRIIVYNGLREIDIVRSLFVLKDLF